MPVVIGRLYRAEIFAPPFQRGVLRFSRSCLAGDLVLLLDCQTAACAPVSQRFLLNLGLRLFLCFFSPLSDTVAGMLYGSTHNSTLIS